jgi:hypothetical protein
MRSIALAALALALLLRPAAADEFEEVVADALEAYRDGDVTVAREELEYAIRILSEREAQTLAAFLPEPLEGWTRDPIDAQGGGLAMAMMGGGTQAAARYGRDGEEFTLTLIARSPMVSSMAAMFSGMAAASGGRSVRIQRQHFSVGENEVQGVVGGSVLVQAEGRAPVEAMQAHIEAMDLRSLGDY